MPLSTSAPFLAPSSSYRPRNPGHDYYGRGTYLITLVIRGRERLLSRFVTELGHESPPTAITAPAVPPAAIAAPPAGAMGRAVRAPERLEQTPLGAMVMQQWLATPQLQALHGNRVAVLAAVCMPDHFHGVIEVLEPMRWSLGDIMQAFKAACTSRWQQGLGLGASSNRPISADCSGEKASAWLREKAARHSDEGSLVRALSKKQRQEYFAFVGRRQQPLFDDNYDDTVCLDERHRQAMVAYVNDNPRRAMLRRMLPDVMRRCLHVVIGGRSYGAFGNLFLLRWARKLQVMCHRRHPVTRRPYEQTDDYAAERSQWEAAIMEGCTVIVTPGISGGEKLMKNECLDRAFPLIHIQKETIGPYWKPEQHRFEACARGSLLILAPWGLDAMGGVNGVPADSDYSRFHNLNAIAAEICAFQGEARIVRG